jgi:DNA helicase II / ATP-dependent DNA helicase PcrA
MLTIEQKAIIKHKRGPAVVTAGPGTGKTHVLCHRVKHLTNTGDSTEEIVMLTFSKAAALNMETRLEEQFEIDNVLCSTIHAYGYRIIRNNYLSLGFTATPKLKSKQLFKRLANIIKRVASRYHIDKRQLEKAVYSVVNDGKNISQIKQDNDLAKSTAEVLKRYQNLKLKKNWINFADMLTLPIQLFKAEPEILKQVRSQIKHLLVDELQDLTMKEAQLIYCLAKGTKSAVLVGDKKQNIYAFKGASIKCWEKLEKMLKPTCYYLTKSFRVPMQLLPLVNTVAADINDDPQLTSNRMGFKPRLFISANNDEQSSFIADEIKKLLAKGVPAKEIAILGHNRKPLALLKNALAMSGIDAIETYRKSDGIPEKVLKSLMRITKWKAWSTGRGRHPFTLVRSLARVLDVTRLPWKLQENIIEQVCKDGLDALHVPKKQGENHYRLVLGLRKAVESAATLDPEAGVQLLIDALKPMMGNRFGKRTNP